MIGRPVVVLVLLAACGGGQGFPSVQEGPDAGVDAGHEDEDAGGLVTIAPEPPAPPQITPCPPGWIEVPDVDDPTIVTCHPFPDDAPLDCPVDQADFPGGGGCERIGTACPAGDFASDLPDVETVYVLAGAAAGGDGSAASPFATIAEGVAAAPDDAVVAISKGTFDEVVTIDHPVTLWGACVAETIVASSSPSDDDAILTFTGRAGGGARNFQMTGARRGIAVTDNEATVEIESIAIHDAVASGIGAEPGLVHVSHVVVRDMQPQVSNLHRGQGFRIALGGQGRLDTVAIERCVANGVRVSDPDTDLVAAGIVVRDTASGADMPVAGYGFQITAGARVELHEVALIRNREEAIVAGQEGTELVADELFISDTLSREQDLLIGFAVHVIEGARAEITRGTFARNRTCGLEAHDPGTVVILTDVVAQDTLMEEADRRGGAGFSFSLGMEATLTRVVSLRDRMAGFMMADPDTRLTLEDGIARDTQTEASDGQFGIGFAVSSKAVAQATRVLLERNRSAGLVAELEASITVSDLDVRGTDVRDDGRFGTGLLAIGGFIDATRLRTADNVLCGVQVAFGGTMDLHDGEVSGNRIGANVQEVADFSLARLQDGVLFVDNVVDLDTSLLPIPDPVPAVEQ
jgi:hypothetical protein